MNRTHFSMRLNSDQDQRGQYSKFDPYLLKLRKDFLETCVKCSAYGDDVQNPHFAYVKSRSRSRSEARCGDQSLDGLFSCPPYIS